MPNWCQNRMSIVGGDIQEISKIIEKDEGVFISDSFLSAPEELPKQFYESVPVGLINPLFEWIAPTLSSEELIEKFGFDDREAWNIENIGTKLDFETDDGPVDLSDGFFYFSTALSPPEAFCKYLSKKFNCVVSLEYAKRDVSFSGATVYSNGLCIEKYCENSIFTKIALELLVEGCSWYIENEDEEFLLNLSDEEKDAILNYENTCEEVLELLRNDKKTKECA